jgi:hypothetical protein
MSLFFFDYGIEHYEGMYDKTQSIGAKLAYDLGYRNSSNLTKDFRDKVRKILQNNITIADIRERMKWHEINELYNMWHHVVKNGVVKQMPFFSPLEVAGWYDDRYVIPAIVMKDKWFDCGYERFQNVCKKNTLKLLHKEHKWNTEKNYLAMVKKVYKYQFRKRLKEEKIGNVSKHLEQVHGY